MTSTAKLKDQARRHEQREEWERAIQVYQRVLSADDEAQGEIDLPLFNRIGDLYLRLGKPDEAVTYYENAAEHYAEAGLFNNAIALCNKALRYAPGRSSLLHKLGSYCAEQGFLTDARRWFLEFAEVQFRAGKLDEAYVALEEFAETTEDPEIREILADRMLSHERTREAVTQLTKAYVLRVRHGEVDAADALRDRLLEMDPSVDLEAAVESASQAPVRQPATSGLDAARLSPESPPPPPPPMDDDDGGELKIESVADSMGFSEDGGGADAEPVTSVDETAAANAADDVAMPHEYGVIEPKLPDDDVATFDTVEAEPLPDLDEEEDADEVTPLPLLDGTSVVEEEDDGEAARDLGGGFDLDAFGFDTDTAGTGTAARPEAPDVDAGLASVDELLDDGDEAGAIAELTRLHTGLADAGDVERALDVVERLIELTPDDLRALQHRVEYAFQLGQQDRLVVAYVALAASLARSGSEIKARAVYQRVLELDSDNAEAREAIHGAAGESSEFVDLASLVRDETPGDGTTRFVVAEEPPSGDEDKDFAEILSQFKAKVSENLGSDDPTGHYDLGLAYKEMGLVDEAIVEFQTALRGGQEQLRVYEELGQCFMLKNQYNVAIKVLSRAAQLPGIDPADLIGVNYHLGRCHEALGRTAEAREAYERVMGVDVNFQDVSERVARL